MYQKQTNNTNDIIFGIRAVIEAVNFDKTIDKILIKRGLKGDLAKELTDLIKERQIPYQIVPDEKLARVTAKNHQGVIAFVSPIIFTPLDELVTQVFEKGETPFFIALDQVTDVRNFGAIVRTAECANVHGIIIPEKGSAQIGSDAVKTSAGALLKVPVCRVNNLKKALQNLQLSGLTVVGATEKAANYYYGHNFTTPICVVMGAEDTGLSDEVLRICEPLVKIPILGQIGSLNVSVAASILMYEVVKQRFNKP